MTHPRRVPIFRETAPCAAPAALATLTVVGAVVFTDVRCRCHGKVMAIPGVVQVEVRFLGGPGEASGRGRVVVCRRHQPHVWVEVIEHG